jgi:hypothetical protein
MQRQWTGWLAACLSGFGMSLIVVSVLVLPRASYAGGDTGPACNEGGDPSMPKGCYGTCDHPKICEAHPIQLVCKCR